MTEQDAIKIYERLYFLFWEAARESGRRMPLEATNTGKVEQIATTFASVLRALREENAALRTSLGEAQGLLASRHFPRPLI